MEIEHVPIESVRPYPGNPRKNDDAVEGVARSIDEFGWQQPIVVDTDNVIVIGHTRFRAAQRLGLATVPVHVATDLSEAQIRALRLVDNRSGEIAEWDTDKLLKEIDELIAMNFNIGDFDFEVDTDPGGAGAGNDPAPEPEIEFSPEIMLEHNFVVLHFTNPLDWQVAVEKFGLTDVRSGDPSCSKVGIGRVLKGEKWLPKL